MSLFHSPKQKLAAGVVAGVTLLGTAAGVATAATTSSAAGVSPGARSAAAALAVAADRGPLTGYWRTADHAAVEFLRGAEWYTIDWDRGVVGSASSTSVTVQRPDGTSVTLAITSATKLHGVSSSGLLTGSRVRVISYDGTALSITVPTGGFGD
jgi:hypothetical protein